MTVSRRRWIAGTIALVFARPLAGLLALTGCGAREPERPDPVLRVPLSEIPPEGRIERVHGRVAVELRREGGEVRARSLLCSHQLCRIDWLEDEQRYLCPCHEGLFAADGTVIYGPPKRPLRELDVTINEGEAWIDTDQVWRAVERRGRADEIEASTDR